MSTIPAGRSKWLTTSEIARYLNVSPVTVRRHAAELGAIRIGRQLRYPPPTAGSPPIQLPTPSARA